MDEQRLREIIRRHHPRGETAQERAERIDREENEKRSIYQNSPATPAQLQADIVAGRGRFKPLGMLEWERKEAEKREKREAEELVMIPVEEFDTEADL